MSHLTDIQLRKVLDSYGEDVGPLNASTRGLWEKRLTKLKSTRIPRKVRKPLSLEIFPSGIETESIFGSHQTANGAFNRNVPVNRIKMCSPSSEKNWSSFEVDSPVTGEPGNSPYPFGTKPHKTPLKKRTYTTRRIFEIETSNIELQEERKMVPDSPRMDGKKRAYGKATASKEPQKNRIEEFSGCDEKYFLAENMVRSKRKTVEIVSRSLWLLIKGGYLVSLASLLIFLMFQDWFYGSDEGRKIEHLE